MKIEDILKKIAEGKELTEEEKEFAKNWKDEKIPKDRLDTEIEKRKEAERKLEEQQTKLTELTEKVESLENGNLSEVEKVKKESEKLQKQLSEQLKKAQEERDKAQGELAASLRKASIADIAAKHKFSDADYLDFLLKGKEVKIDDENAVNAFMGELVKSSPHLFKSDVQSGGGTGQGNGGGTDIDTKKSRMEELLKKDTLTVSESSEVIRLSEEVKQAEASAGGQQQ